MKIISTFAGTILLLLALAGPALACTCTVRPFDTEFSTTTDVFTALSMGSRTAEPEFAVHHWEVLSVHAIWKGSVGPSVEVLIPNDGATCGMYLVPGQVYLVFATQFGEPLETHTCSRTGIYSPTDPIWGQLGNPISTPAGVASWGALKATYHR